LLGLCEECLKCVHVFVDVANFAPFAACFGEKSGVRDKRVVTYTCGAAAKRRLRNA